MKLTLRRVLIALLATSVAAWLGLLAVQHFVYRPDPEYSKIEDGLYMGGLIDEPPPGVTAVLNLCEMEDPYKCDIHEWRPIRDAKPGPSLDWLSEQVEFVETQHASGKTVYVHCFQGASRNGLVVVAYMMHKHGWTRDEAMEEVRSRRPQLRPNPTFMKLLGDWEAKCQAKRAE